MVIVATADKKTIYNHLFKNGCVCVKKDFSKPVHSEDLPMPNLHVRMICKSLCSRGYVSEKFNWGHFYYILTDAGIDYIRAQLHLPEGTNPGTIQGESAPVASAVAQLEAATKTAAPVAAH